MTDRLDALMTRSYQSGGETKTAYTKLGVAFPLDGGGYRLKLDALPVPTIYDGKVECTMLLVPPRDPDQSPQRPAMSKDKSQRNLAPAFDSGAGDDIPFAAEWRV